MDLTILIKVFGTLLLIVVLFFSLDVLTDTLIEKIGDKRVFEQMRKQTEEVKKYWNKERV